MHDYFLQMNEKERGAELVVKTLKKPVETRKSKLVGKVEGSVAIIVITYMEPMQS